jgi:hypothetical protein
VLTRNAASASSLQRRRTRTVRLRYVPKSEFIAVDGGVDTGDGVGDCDVLGEASLMAGATRRRDEKALETVLLLYHDLSSLCKSPTIPLYLVA